MPIIKHHVKCCECILYNRRWVCVVIYTPTSKTVTKHLQVWQTQTSHIPGRVAGQSSSLSNSVPKHKLPSYTSLLILHVLQSTSALAHGINWAINKSTYKSLVIKYKVKFKTAPSKNQLLNYTNMNHLEWISNFS